MKKNAFTYGPEVDVNHVLFLSISPLFLPFDFFQNYWIWVQKCSGILTVNSIVWRIKDTRVCIFMVRESFYV
jgi:hypothetical protein